MLRSLYQLVLRAHPPYFRQRFAEEMQSIFDQAESRPAAAGLLADAVLSLLRQWSVRPQFWEDLHLRSGGGRRCSTFLITISHAQRRWFTGHFCQPWF